MLKIGELAKIYNISTQTLRYYDSEGLLCPEEVDRFSGYRYYSSRQVETLDRILKLKSLGFELSEIKEFLSCGDEERLALYRNKIDELKSEVDSRHENISELKRLCEGKPAVKDLRHISLVKQMQEIGFENDEQAIGKWKYVGRIKALAKDPARLISPANLDTERVHCPENLYFLPGGGFYWGYFWSRGVLYSIFADYCIIIPNEYKIFESDGGTYMLINWIDEGCITGDGVSSRMLYKKLDSRHYSDKSTRVCRDNTDIPFVPDPDLLGKWTACALVSTPDEFSPDDKYEPDSLHTLGLKVMQRGICYKELRGTKDRNEKPLLYSKGFIINHSDEIAERYEIREYGDEKYLILEHKSGDYKYGGKIYAYYVFKKEK